MDVCVILPAFCGVIVSGELLKQLGPSERHVATPKAGLPHAPTSGCVAIPFLAVWNLASCSKHEALRMTQVDQSRVLFEASFQRNWGGPLGVQKANVSTAPKMRLLQ